MQVNCLTIMSTGYVRHLQDYNCFRNLLMIQFIEQIASKNIISVQRLSILDLLVRHFSIGDAAVRCELW